MLAAAGMLMLGRENTEIESRGTSRGRARGWRNPPYFRSPPDLASAHVEAHRGQCPAQGHRELSLARPVLSADRAPPSRLGPFRVKPAHGPPSPPGVTVWLPRVGTQGCRWTGLIRKEPEGSSRGLPCEPGGSALGSNPRGSGRSVWLRDGHSGR